MTVEEFFRKYKTVCSRYNCVNCPLNEKFNTIDNMCLKTNALYPDGFTFDNLNALILKIEEVIANGY